MIYWTFPRVATYRPKSHEELVSHMFLTTEDLTSEEMVSISADAMSVGFGKFYPVPFLLWFT